VTTLNAKTPFVIGLDLGVRSLGWSILELKPDGEPGRIVRTGVRCFEAGVEGDVEKGMDLVVSASR